MHALKSALTVMLTITLGMNAQTKDKAMEQQVSYRTLKVDGLYIFYREAGPKDAPTILLLHGLPSSSRMFQPLLTRLAGNYHLVAPDHHRSDVIKGVIELLWVGPVAMSKARIAGADSKRSLL
jgi:hypothetical protein